MIIENNANKNSCYKYVFVQIRSERSSLILLNIFAVKIYIHQVLS